jgi:hypothetical protein
MFERIVEGFVFLLSAYALLGFLFSLAFVSVGVSRIDHDAKGTGIVFRLLIIPGVIAFWPMLLSRWMRGVSEPPVERTPHR